MQELLIACIHAAEGGGGGLFCCMAFFLLKSTARSVSTLWRNSVSVQRNAHCSVNDGDPSEFWTRVVVPSRPSTKRYFCRTPS